MGSGSRSRWRTGLLLAGVWLLIAGAGCIDQCEPPFPPASVVDKWRVLAIKTEPPEIAPGEATTLTFLSADPKGLIKASTYLPFPSCLSDKGPVDPSAFWVGCLLGVGPVQKTDFSCADVSFLQGGSGSPDGGVADGGSPDGGGFPEIDPKTFRVAIPPCGEPATWTAPSDYLDPLSEADRVKGGEALLVHLARYQGQDQITLKRLRISTREASRRNKNPRLLGLNVASQDLVCCRPENPEACRPLDVPSDTKVEIKALYDPASQEALPEPLPEQPKEHLQIAWFITQGELDVQSTLVSGAVTAETSRWPKWYPNDYKGKLLSVGTEVTLVAIVRDFRGGADWIACRLNVTEPLKK